MFSLFYLLYIIFIKYTLYSVVFEIWNSILIVICNNISSTQMCTIIG